MANYRTPLPTVRETQWKQAREALERAVRVAPGNRRLKASLRYCEGQIHRINGEARKARRKTVEAQQEFTDAVTAFRGRGFHFQLAAGSFLGLSCTFIYGPRDVDRGADAPKQAERYGFTPGDRDIGPQPADGYRAVPRRWRGPHTLEGTGQEQEYLTRASEAYKQSLELYAKAAAVPGVARTIRVAERGLKQIEQRLADLSRPAEQPTTSDVR
jgi:hypothetical protein